MVLRLTFNRSKKPSLPTDESWTQLDHIAVSYRWRHSVKDCRAFWSNHLDSDHAVVRARFVLSFAQRTYARKCKVFNWHSSDEDVKNAYQKALAEKLPSSSQTNDPNEHWEQIAGAMKACCEQARSEGAVQFRQNWISVTSINLMNKRRSIPPGSEYDDDRRELKRMLTKSLRKDREHYLVQQSKEMEKAFLSGNSRRLFSLIRGCTGRQVGVSETICEKDGSLITSQSRRLDRWAEHFEEQFSWPQPDHVDDGTRLVSYCIPDGPPLESEVFLELKLMKRNKAPGPDLLSPSLFKDGGVRLLSELTKLLQTIWETEEVPRDWCLSTVIPVFKKGSRSLCDNHRGISLVSVASKLLTGLILRRLTKPRESQIREEQAGFRSGRGCVDHIFTLRRILEHRHSYRQPTAVVFLDLRAAFDSVARNVLWSCLLRKGVPEKYVNLLRSLYAHSASRVRVYGQLSRAFITSSGVRQGCPISPFLFNFVMDDILEGALRESSGLGVELLPGARLTDLEYADDIVLLSPSAEDMQTMLNKVSDRAGLYGMHFAPSKCKVLLQDWGISNPTFFIAGNPLETVDSFTYLGSTISSACNIADEISARIAKARVAFSKLRHLWRRKDVRLSLKGRVYNACVRSILLYGSETWPVRKQDINRLAVFDHRCLRHLAHIKWADRVSNVAVRRRVFRNVPDARSFGQLVTLHSLRWLGHVLRMPAERLPYRASCTEAINSWVKPRGGQATTRSRNMKTLTAPLSKVGRHRLPG
ncbi:uncharacterized protein DEA37_0001165 [Paragonimus westermani]|uniref:Reverse transcriptase domain-containing protein n=1 Tax=Paragonimus westermani TaxID=34504 RepID=A0A5J4NHR8_9TREM|nr:uncharacterized protein DEA37_0001165 [Paragonimus westermani]